METVKKFSQQKNVRTLLIWARMITYDISKECEIAVSTSQNTASAHKAQHTLSQISNNSYPEAQKVLRNLLSNRIKRGTTCENIHKREKMGARNWNRRCSSLTIASLNFRAEKRKRRAASIFPPSRIVIKGEWCTETPSFHRAILKKVSRKHIDVICFTHFPQSNKT